jgi:1-phosphofructokinase
MSADVCVLGGPSTPDVLPADTYRRLAADVTGNGTLVIADLSGKPLKEAVAGGASLVKSSHEDLVQHGQVEGDDQDQLLAVMAKLREAGAGAVVVSRAEKPALALLEDGMAVEVHGPQLEPNDVRGAGDSMTAGIAAGLAKGLDLAAALCLGAAAGSLNVTRRGLATGDAEAIERLNEQVELRKIESTAS